MGAVGSARVIHSSVFESVRIFTHRRHHSHHLKRTRAVLEVNEGLMLRLHAAAAAAATAAGRGAD